MPSNFLIGIFVISDELTHGLRQCLEGNPYVVNWGVSDLDFLAWVIDNRQKIDCLLIQDGPDVNSLFRRLQEQDILLPTLLISDEWDSSLQPEGRRPPSPEAASSNANNAKAAAEAPPPDYHGAVIRLTAAKLDQLEQYIHQAIDQFLKLPAARDETDSQLRGDEASPHLLLSLQQQRLAEKLKERLGYLGVYYKRNPQNFLRNMTQAERQEFLEKLRTDYRMIVLKYFSKDSNLNQKIDDYVNVAFFADISVSQLVEIHMDLMDEFSKQLQLEGRSEDILLDYRLTLIDVIAHLCEMYRRSIPREM